MMIEEKCWTVVRKLRSGRVHAALRTDGPTNSVTHKTRADAFKLPNPAAQPQKSGAELLKRFASRIGLA
jgi:hypothetical protein